MIQASKLTKKYGDKAAIQDVSFNIDKGEVVGFLGPNGAGKTTTMRILTGYIPPSSGEVKIGGLDVFDNSLEVRRKLGYLPENTPLYLDMDVEVFLKYIAALKKVTKEKRSNHVGKIMRVCGINNVRQSTIKTLSKGYRQRVGIAQALIGDPEYLILDEPTIGLDPKQIIEIRELIKSLAEDKTIILSTHILPEVSVTCSRVIIISEGKIVAEDTPDNLENKLSGVAKVLLTVKGPGEEISSRLRGVTGVKKVNIKKTQSGDLVDLEVASQKKIDVRGQLAQAIVQNNWDLLEMRREVLGLEEIFLKLTTKE